VVAPGCTGSVTPTAALLSLVFRTDLSAASELLASGSMPTELLCGVPLSVAASSIAGSLPSRGSCLRAATEGEQGTLLGLRQHFDGTVSIASCARQPTLSKLGSVSLSVNQ